MGFQGPRGIDGDKVRRTSFPRSQQNAYLTFLCRELMVLMVSRELKVTVEMPGKFSSRLLDLERKVPEGTVVWMAVQVSVDELDKKGTQDFRACRDDQETR